jgi:hypothetical protein
LLGGGDDAVLVLGVATGELGRLFQPRHHVVVLGQQGIVVAGLGLRELDLWGVESGGEVSVRGGRR